MVSTLIRLLVLRILPGRLVPVLTAVEVARLVQRWRRSRRPVPERPAGAAPSSPAMTRAGRSREPRSDPPPRSRA